MRKHPRGDAPGTNECIKDNNCQIRKYIKFLTNKEYSSDIKHSKNCKISTKRTITPSKPTTHAENAKTVSET